MDEATSKTTAGTTSPTATAFPLTAAGARCGNSANCWAGE